MSKRRKNDIEFVSYLVVKCKPLDDQYECEVDRTPMFLTTDREEAFNGRLRDYDHFEVYGVTEHGLIKLIKPWDEFS